MSAEQVLTIAEKWAKQAHELAFWKRRYAEVIGNENDPVKRERLFLDSSWQDTFPRYMRDLRLEADSLQGLRVLDVGCGPNGGLLGFGACMRWGVDHLIDAYKEIGFPLDRHDIQYSSIDCEHLPYPNGVFDVVVCVNALDHFDDLDCSIAQIGRVLKNGGLFRVQVNIHASKKVAEPLILSHELLHRTLLAQGLRIRKRSFQYAVADEERYLYVCERMSW